MGNSELVQQVSSIRSALNEIPNDTIIITRSQIQELERKMKTCLESKSKLAKSLEAEEIRTKEFEDSIEVLRNEVTLQKTALKKSENDLASLKHKDKELQRLTNDVRIERLSNSRMFQKDLLKIIESYQGIWELFDYFPPEVESSEQNSVEFSESQNLKAICDIKDCGTSDKVHNPDISAHPKLVDDTKRELSESGHTEKENKSFEDLEAFINLKVTCGQENEELENELIALCLSLQETEKKITEQSKHIQTVFVCLKMEFCQFLNENHTFWKECLGIKMLGNKLQRLQQLQKHTNCKPDEDNFSYNEHPDVEDNKLVLQILRNEQALLESLIKNVYKTVGEDFEKYLCLCKNRDLFLRIYH